MPLQCHVADDLRVEQANRVTGRAVAEARQEFVGDGGAADIGRSLQDRHLHSLAGQIEGAGQAVMARSDDDRVVQASPVLRYAASMNSAATQDERKTQSRSC